MPTSIRVFRATDFIHAAPNGELQIGRSMQVLRDIAAATRDLEDCEILLDVRRVKGVLNPQELWQLSQELLKHRRTFAHRTAVLCPFERFDRATFFALCAENAGFNMQVFTSYEEAIEWLLGSVG